MPPVTQVSPTIIMLPNISTGMKTKRNSSDPSPPSTQLQCPQRRSCPSHAWHLSRHHRRGATCPVVSQHVASVGFLASCRHLGSSYKRSYHPFRRCADAKRTVIVYAASLHHLRRRETWIQYHPWHGLHDANNRPYRPDCFFSRGRPQRSFKPPSRYSLVAARKARPD